MAAPNKEGLDYFAHDAGLSSDAKVEYLESDHGITGYGIYLKLLEKIYRNSYYIKFTKRDVILMSRRTGVEEEKITKIVNTCVRERIFNKDIFEKYNVLTSRGIQKRYVKACERRKILEMVEELVLVDDLPATVSMVKIDNCSDFVDDEDYKDMKIKVRGGEPAHKEDEKKKPKPEYEAEVYRLYDLFISTLTNGQELGIPKKEKDINLWLDVLDKCKRLDKYEWWQIADIINIARSDDFWYKKFLTPLKLRIKNPENKLYIEYFWLQYQDLLEKPEESSIEYIEGLIGSEDTQKENENAI